MTLNPFCIAGGESGTLATHLYLRLSMVFRELRVHTLMYTQVGAQMEYRAMEGEAEKCREEEEKNDRAEGTEKLQNTSGYFCPKLFLKKGRQYHHS